MLSGWSILALVTATAAGQVRWNAREAARAEERRAYYARWVGVAAPEFGREVRDRLVGPRVQLEAFRGRKALLYSFDSGNFVEGPERCVFPENLRKLERAVGGLEGVDLAVVGFTQGVVFFFPVEVPEEVRRLSRFPVVAWGTAAAAKCAEPYSLLLRPGGIVIDRNGVIQAIFTEAMSERQIREALAAPDWTGPVRPAPVDDPWNGGDAPRPRGVAVRVWSIDMEGLVGLTRGDWDGDGLDDVIVLQADGRLTVLDATGDEKTVVPMSAVSGRPLALRLRRGPQGPEVMQCGSGWPHGVSVHDAAGEEILRYPDAEMAGILTATWADLDGDGVAGMLAGFGGFGGLHLVSGDGEVRWVNHDVKNRWCVAGLDARDGRPGLALSSGADGAIRVYDAAGREVNRLVGDRGPIEVFAAAEMSKAGDRQVLFVQEAMVGRIDEAVAADLGGNLLWRYPAVELRLWRSPAPMAAADVTGDGVKEWVFRASKREVVAVDVEGSLVARFPTEPEGPVLLTATRPAAGVRDVVVVGGTASVAAYEIRAAHGP